MAITWDLAEIRKKVRLVTGRPTTVQLSNDDLDNYIDNYYRNVLPLQTSSDEFAKFASSAGFTGTTVAGTGEYALGSDVFGIGKPLIFDGEPMSLTYDLNAFMNDFPPSATTQSKPTHGLIYERKLYLRPLPDDNDGSNYTFEAPKLDRPTSLTATSDQPIDQMFGPAISYGASIDILLDRGEDGEAAKAAKILKSYITLIFRKDIASEIGRSAIPSF